MPLDRCSPDAVVLAALQISHQGQIAHIDLSARRSFVPGLILANPSDELGAVLLNQQQSSIEVKSARAINAQGICFTSPQTTIAIAARDEASGNTLMDTLTQTFGLNKSLNSSVTVTLYLQPPSGASADEADQAQINIVPEGTGIITFRDNRTYVGDWVVQIPSARSLYLSAASGYRPHLQGNGTVYALSDELEPGDLQLDGLLIEGKLTAIGKHLKHLSVQHCTLVPQKGGLLLSPADATDAESSTDGAPNSNSKSLAEDWRQLIRSLLNIPLSAPPVFDPAALQSAIAQLSQMVTQEIKQLVAMTQQGLKHWSCKTEDLCDWLHACKVVKQEACPARIETVDIQRSLCGPVWLGEGIAQLQVTDSLIENGRTATPIGAVAIAAPYTAVTIHNTTVLGTTTAQTLESSNSLFNEGVVTLQRQTGCLRFCYVPETSHTPTRYRCQPDQALSESLDTLPAPISAIAGHSSTGRIFIGTLGQGLFEQATNTDSAQNNTPPTWKKVSAFDRQTITALLTYSLFQDSEEPSENPTSEEKIFAFAATAEGRLYRLRPNDSEESNWISVLTEERDSPETYITTLSVYQRQCSGQVQILPSASFDADVAEAYTSGIEGTILQGTETAFLSELKLGDMVEFGPYRSKVIHIDSDEQMIVDAIANLPAETSAGTDNADGPSYKITIHNLFAGTAGSGLFRFTPNDGHSWTPVNQGLTHRWVSAVAIDPQGHLFVGTLGGGIFCSRDNGSHWEEINSGLENHSISALHCDRSGEMLAGTSGSGLFVLNPGCDNEGSQEEARWDAINGADKPNPLLNLNITAISRYTLPAAPIDEPTDETTDDLTDESPSDDDGTPSSDFASESEPEMAPVDPSIIIVGTDGGGLFRSLDEGNNWKSISPSFANLNITTLLTLSNNKGDEATVSFLAGTAVGSLVYASDSLNLSLPRSSDGIENVGRLWQSANSGLPGVDEKLLILRRLQPSFAGKDYGSPGYGQLSTQCPSEILTGAEDGAEIGLFNYLKQPQREANLRASLNEYLRFGLEAGIFYQN